jgi:hypothetical protein
MGLPPGRHWTRAGACDATHLLLLLLLLLLWWHLLLPGLLYMVTLLRPLLMLPLLRGP